MWNHLSGLFYVYPKDFGSFEEFVRAFFEAGGDHMERSGPVSGAAGGERILRRETFESACAAMPTEKIRGFLKGERRRPIRRPSSAPSGKIFGLDRRRYEYQRFYMADLAKASLRAEELGVHYGVQKADHPDRIDFAVALYQAKKKWDAQGGKVRAGSHAVFVL